MIQSRSLHAVHSTFTINCVAFKVRDAVPAIADFVPWVFNFRDWAELRTNNKWTQQVAKYHHYRFRAVPESVFVARGVDAPLYRTRCHMKEWDLEGLEWHPPSLIEKKTRSGIVKVPCHGLRVMPSQNFDEFVDVGVAPFEGELINPTTIWLFCACLGLIWHL